jgi:ribose transport system substrate-binding protein
MRTTRSRGKALVALLAALALVLTACNGDNGDDPDTGADDTNGNGEAEGDDDEAAAGPFTIGVSNGFTGSEWRTQMIANIEDVFAEYEEQGLVDELIIENDDVDEAGQIEQIRNLVNQGADVIIVNPNSPDALNAAFEEAAAEGVQIYAVDQAVTSDAVTNVVIDQFEWAQISAEWLTEQLGDDQVVGVNGIAGHPANEARWNGAQEALEGGGLEILAQGNANWSQAEGQTVMQELLNQYGDDIEGVWAQDGVAEGVLRTLIDEDRLDLVTTGEARAGYLRLWEEAGIDTIGVVNPPGVGATALRVAMLELQGEAVDDGAVTDGNTLLLPMPDTVTNDNLDEWLAEVEDQPDGYSIDVILSEDELRELFFQ